MAGYRIGSPCPIRQDGNLANRTIRSGLSGPALGDVVGVVESDADDLAGAEHRWRVPHAVRGHGGGRGGGQLAELFHRVSAAGVQVAHVAQPGQVGTAGGGGEFVHTPRTRRRRRRAGGGPPRLPGTVRPVSPTAPFGRKISLSEIGCIRSGSYFSPQDTVTAGGKRARPSDTVSQETFRPARRRAFVTKPVMCAILRHHHVAVWGRRPDSTTSAMVFVWMWRAPETDFRHAGLASTGPYAHECRFHAARSDMNAAFTSYEEGAGPGSRGHGRVQEYM